VYNKYQLHFFLFVCLFVLSLALNHQIKKNEVAGHVERMGEESVQGFGGKSRRKQTTWKAKE
jgi:hypothetical protein